MDNRQTKRIWGDENGGSLVEFVLIAPLLLIIVFGIIEFGLLLYNKAMLTNASREGARAGIVAETNDNGTPLDTTDDTQHPDDTTITNAINTYCQDYLITFGSGSLNIPTPARGGPGGGDEPGDSLTVTVNYHYDFLVLPGFIAALTGGVDLSAVTTMRLE